MQKTNIVKIAFLIAVVLILSSLCLMLLQMNKSFEPHNGARFISNFLGLLL